MERKRKKGDCLSTILLVSAAICIFVIAAGLFWMKAPDIKKKVRSNVQQNSEIPFQEVTISEEEMQHKYYYQQLSENERVIYKEIAEGVRQNTADIYVHSSDADRTNMIFQYVLKDFPEIFWCEGSTRSTTYEEPDAYTILQPAYSYSEEEKVMKKMEIEAAVNMCLSGLSPDASEYEKILYVYDYIVDTVDYDLNAPDNQNIYSVFINKKSVCAGYSRAAQYLLERMGIFCTYVTGVTKDNENHAWNLVKCGGDYYYVDVTWGDPVFQASEENTAINDNYISYDYMCCNDDELFKTHIPDRDVELPACTKMDFNYYVRNGMYYTQYEGGQVLKAMNDVIAAKGNTVVFKFANTQLYDQAREDMMNVQIKAAAQNLAQWYGLGEVKYQYMDEAELNKITIYWQYE